MDQAFPGHGNYAYAISKTRPKLMRRMAKLLGYAAIVAAGLALMLSYFDILVK
jgi:capsular polysaccharide biosynthesis protein